MGRLWSDLGPIKKTHTWTKSSCPAIAEVTTANFFQLYLKIVIFRGRIKREFQIVMFKVRPISPSHPCKSQSGDLIICYLWMYVWLLFMFVFFISVMYLGDFCVIYFITWITRWTWTWWQSWLPLGVLSLEPVGHEGSTHATEICRSFHFWQLDDFDGVPIFSYCFPKRNK